jgi:hypothetical protein
MRWKAHEISRLKMILETEQGHSLHSMAKLAQQKLKNRSVLSISHKLRELVSKQELQVDNVEIDGVTYPATVLSGYVHVKIDESGYQLLHHYIWKQKNGDIPRGYHIHHIDNNRANNDLNNLMLLTAEDHQRLHHASKPAESAIFFWYMQDKNLWEDYLVYREAIIEVFPFPED